MLTPAGMAGLASSPDARLETSGKHDVEIAPQELAILFESDRHLLFATWPRIFGDVRVFLEIKLCGERHMQRFRNSEMDMSRTRQPRVFLQPWKVWRDRVCSRHDGFELIVSLL